MSITLQFEALDKLLSMVDPTKFERTIDTILQNGGAIWRDETKKLPPVSGPRDGYGARGVPVDSGLTRQMIGSRKVSAVALEIFGGTQYSGYVHEGTSRVPPRPFFLYALEDGAMEKIGMMARDEFLYALSA
jgi:hypothetical protein